MSYRHKVGECSGISVSVGSLLSLHCWLFHNRPILPRPGTIKMDRGPIQCMLRPGILIGPAKGCLIGHCWGDYQCVFILCGDLVPSVRLFGKCLKQIDTRWALFCIQLPYTGAWIPTTLGLMLVGISYMLLG